MIPCFMKPFLLEVVEAGFPYVAGRSSLFFAMITPIVWYTQKMEVKARQFSRSALHAFLRVFHGHYGRQILGTVGG